MRIAIIIIIILILGAVFIVTQQKMNLTNFENSALFLKSYGKWLWQLGGNIKTLTLAAYNLKWLPNIENKSIS